jgi:integrase
MSAPTLERPFKDAGNLKWYVCWTEGRRSKRVSTRTADLDAAKVFLGQWLLMERAEAPDGAALTVADLWTVYDAKHVRIRVTAPKELEYCWKALEPHFGALTVSEVTQDVVDRYVTKRTTGRLGRPVKPQTCRKELSVLVACMNFAADHKQRLIAPALVPKLDLPDAGEPRDRWLRTEEMQRLLVAAGKMRRGSRLSRGERFLWLALETAARKSALLDLTWERVDFETGVIHLDVPGRKKTKKGRADVPISKALLPILQRAYAEREGELVLDNKGAVWATVQLIAIKAGFSAQVVAHSQKPKATGIGPHVLRHTAATHMARRGVPLWIIAKVLGNTLAMVEKVYAKHSPDDLREAVNSISSGQLEAAE